MFKKIFSVTLVVLFFGGVLCIAYSFGQPDIRILDAVTGAPIKNVEVRFYYNCPGPIKESVAKENIANAYDRFTCNGKYKKIKNHYTDENGAIHIKNKLSLLGRTTIRYYVIIPANYINTRSYQLGDHSVVRLIPKSAPINSKKSAIEYLSKEKTIQQIFKYFKSYNMIGSYLYVEKEAFYGAWRVTINFASETQRNVPDSVVIMVSPNAGKYIICNPSYEKTKTSSDSIRKYWVGKHEFLGQFENAVTYDFGTEGCSTDLLFTNK